MRRRSSKSERCASARPFPHEGEAAADAEADKVAQRWRRALREVFSQGRSSVGEGDQHGDQQGDLGALFARRLLERLQQKGLSPEGISAHSLRKGGATFALSGGPDAPGFIGVAMRACWSLGGG